MKLHAIELPSLPHTLSTIPKAPLDLLTPLDIGSCEADLRQAAGGRQCLGTYEVISILTQCVGFGRLAVQTASAYVQAMWHLRGGRSSGEETALPAWIDAEQRPPYCLFAKVTKSPQLFAANQSEAELCVSQFCRGLAFVELEELFHARDLQSVANARRVLRPGPGSRPSFWWFTYAPDQSADPGGIDVGNLVRVEDQVARRIASYQGLEFEEIRDGDRAAETQYALAFRRSTMSSMCKGSCGIRSIVLPAM